ncbi:hypothetical protein HII36_03365 [Nonomuraea sp. NN258]|uniref:RNA polymerase sigma factor n=1 Tax=Nonomuraea antri TaxID=2730852 RepID=UPI0015697BDD|nr:RNA polymerase sigma factor [Nonomuraea antri]NRQ30878.1 hypothetical protein [Nonomuraea antri]
MSESEIFDRRDEGIDELQRYVQKIIRRRLPDFPDDIDDLAREVLVAVRARLAAGATIVNVRGYAAASARNECASFLKKKEQERKARPVSAWPPVATEGSDALDVLDRAIDPGERVHAGHTRKRTEEALLLLPEDVEKEARAAFAKELEGLSSAPRRTVNERQARSRLKWPIRAAARVLLHVELDGKVSVDGETTCAGFKKIVSCAHGQRLAAQDGRLSVDHLKEVVKHFRQCPCSALEVKRIREGMRDSTFLVIAGAADEITDEFELVSSEGRLPRPRPPRSRPARHPARATQRRLGTRPVRGRSYKGQALTFWTLLFMLAAVLLTVQPQARELASALFPSLPGERPAAAGQEGQKRKTGPGRSRKKGDPPVATKRPGKSSVKRPKDRQPAANVHEQPEQAQPELAQPEQAQPELAQPEQAQPEEAQPEQAQPEQAQPEKKPEVVEAQPVLPEQQPQSQPVVATPTYTLTTRVTGTDAYLVVRADGKKLGICAQSGNAVQECSWQVAKDTKVTLTAPAHTTEWRQGPCSGQALTCGFTMSVATLAEVYLSVPG